MKLHLPYSLRVAVLACTRAAKYKSASVATCTMAAGLFYASLNSVAVAAEYTYVGDNDGWAESKSNWENADGDKLGDSGFLNSAATNGNTFIISSGQSVKAGGNTGGFAGATINIETGGTLKIDQPTALGNQSTVNIEGTLSVPSGKKLGPATIMVNSGGTLEVNGVIGAATITLSENSTFITDGDTKLSGTVFNVAKTLSLGNVWLDSNGNTGSATFNLGDEGVVEIATLSYRVEASDGSKWGGTYTFSANCDEGYLTGSGAIALFERTVMTFDGLTANSGDVATFLDDFVLGDFITLNGDDLQRSETAFDSANLTSSNVGQYTFILDADNNLKVQYVAYSSNTPPVPIYTDFYWESGSSEWAGDKWATTDDDSNLVNLPTSGTVNVIFNDSETATVTIGDSVSISSMRVEAGSYTFAGNANSRIEIDGSLTVANGATADIQTGLSAASINVAGTLSLTGDIEVPSVIIDGTGELNLSNTTIDSTMAITNNGTLNISDSTIESAFDNNNIVNLSGAINLQGIAGTSGAETIPTASNGYATVTTTYTVVSGGTSSGSGVTDWQIDGQSVDGTTDFSNGVLSVTTSGTVYYVTVDEVTYDGGSDFAGATDIALNGGTLLIGTSPIADDFISSTIEGGVIDLNGNAFAQSKLDSLKGNVLLKGNIDSLYDLGSETALGDKISLSSTDWKGTVQMGDINTPVAALNITSLGTQNSKIQLGTVNVQSLASGSQASVSAAALTLGGDSNVVGDLSVAGALTLGNESSAAKLTVAGMLSAPQGVTLGNAGSTLTVGALSGSSINIVVDNTVFRKLSRESLNGAITLVTVTGGNITGITPLLNGQQVINEQGNKYVTDLNWNGNDLQLTAKANENYISERIAPTSQNGKAGADMLGSLFAEIDPESTAPQGDAAALLRAVDAALISEKELAAVAGSSVTALGMAFSGDVERQLKAIRNRTTTMGVNQSMVNEGMPYFNAWVNAEGSHNELDGCDTAPGYKLDSWGGTVGFDVDFTPQFTMGVAMTAMYGDISTDGPDNADGDLDTYYVSLFGRYCESAWTHTFVATIGKMDASLERTVSYPGRAYSTEGDTEGMSFGMMYEMGYVIALDEESQTCLQPIFNISLRHTTVDGYTETGADTALEVGKQSLTTCTLGLGARMQSIVGETLYNRSSIFEARALAKADIGDRYSEAEVGFVAGGNRTDVRSEEIGAFGVELGAGLTIPVGDDDGAIFMDASLELRSGYTNVNGTVGYRINF